MGGPRVKSTVRQTGNAEGGPGSIVNTGHLHVTGDVHLAGAPVARSAYRDQVEQIFPWELIGREAELAELAEFCTGDHDQTYVWWQGPAWAGKSALLATFVLHPPPGVRVVSFFITARYAGQSDRNAFLRAVIEQLAELLGQPMPPLLDEVTQQGWYGRLLKEAARHCRARGERLVLVVDGLDEDRGVKLGPGAHSIAALLPEVPPEGMRVVVAGRPNPPVPSDVPPRHPLRDPSIVHSLSPSPAAQGIKEAAERELDELLFGGQVERDLLGLLVAAEGGLSSGDLAELTGLTPGEVDRRLRTAYGRSFSSRESAWRPNGTRVFVLAHEELHNSAVAALGESALACYRKRIHAWADDYRDRGWPAGTPEYLLRGYHQMLRSCDEVERMVSFAVDRARLDRMLAVSGGDAAGLAEVATCLQLLSEQEDPDLGTLMTLARTRDFLTDRNTHIPARLPVVWVKLGNVLRAEALAQSHSDPAKRTEALCEVSVALAESGRVDQAEQVLWSISDLSDRVRALTRLARVLAWEGRGDRAERVVDRAEEVARSISDRLDQVRALVEVAKALAEIGHFDRAEWVVDRAERVVDRAEEVARTVTDPAEGAEALAIWSRSWSRPGGWIGRRRWLVPSAIGPSKLGRCSRWRRPLPRPGRLIGPSRWPVRSAVPRAMCGRCVASPRSW